MFTQKEAVFHVVKSFYGDKFKNGQEYPQADKREMVNILMEMYNSGEWEIKSEQENLRSYVVGLLNNHLRKDVRLNGGNKYEPKRKGSRSGDATVKAIRQLMKILDPESEEYARANDALNKRLAELNKVEIDVEALPAELRGLVG